jgi:CBS domain containing-hemolysin-like protein
MASELIVAVLLVLANGFFVAVEFSVARLRPTMAEEMVREGKPGAKSALHAVEHIDSYLSARQLGITVSSLGLGAIGEPAFHDLLEPILGDAATIAGFGLATLVAFLIITTLHVVIGELSPRAWRSPARRRSPWPWRRSCALFTWRRSPWWRASTRWGT